MYARLVEITKLFGVRGMAQVEYLLCKHKDVGSDLRPPRKELVMVAHLQVDTQRQQALASVGDPV